jgi:hypothetical protein
MTNADLLPATVLNSRFISRLTAKVNADPQSTVRTQSRAAVSQAHGRIRQSKHGARQNGIQTGLACRGLRRVLIGRRAGVSFSLIGRPQGG